MSLSKPRAAESRLRAPRFAVETDLMVTSRTIGSAINYNLTTNDLSRSGLLLSWRHKVNTVPFRENTLLEMVIDPQQTLLSNPVNCIGKVVRKIEKDKIQGPNVNFGIQIVQIDNADLDAWDNCIEYLSSNAKHLITNTAEFLKKDSEEDDNKTKNFKRTG